MIIMSVDLGKARTGLAVCDKTEFLASPYTVIFEKSPKMLPQRVAEAVREAKAELVVVGLPKNMDGTEGESARNARAFAETLTELTGVETVMQDERGTTITAQIVALGMFGAGSALTTAIIFSAHNMPSAEELCDDIALINHARVVLSGTLADIKAQNPGKALDRIFIDTVKQ